MKHTTSMQMNDVLIFLSYHYMINYSHRDWLQILQRLVTGWGSCKSSFFPHLPTSSVPWEFGYLYLRKIFRYEPVVYCLKKGISYGFVHPLICTEWRELWTGTQGISLKVCNYSDLVPCWTLIVPFVWSVDIVQGSCWYLFSDLWRIPSLEKSTFMLIL